MSLAPKFVKELPYISFAKQIFIIQENLSSYLRYVSLTFDANKKLLTSVFLHCTSHFFDGLIHCNDCGFGKAWDFG